MDRFALVTGTSRGLGAACAAELLRREWCVVGLSRGPAPPELSHANYAHHQIDLADLEALQAFCEGPLVEEHGAASALRLGLVNNAGTLEPMGPAHKLPAAALGQSLLANVAAPMWLVGHFLQLAGKRPLRILDVSSGAAHKPYPGWSAYCAAKSALLRFDQVVGVEREETPALAEHDLALVSYAPHVVATAMQASIREMDPADFPRRARFDALLADGELVEADAVALEMAALLESDDLPAYSERRYEP